LPFPTTTQQNKLKIIAQNWEVFLYLPIFVYLKQGKMIFGNRIRELREEKGLLLRQLASLLEVDTATISKIERGTRRAKKEQLQIFSSVLDISQKELETLWLADKLYEIVEDENDLGLSALKVAEDEFKYQIKIKG